MRVGSVDLARRLNKSKCAPTKGTVSKWKCQLDSVSVDSLKTYCLSADGTLSPVVLQRLFTLSSRLFSVSPLSSTVTEPAYLQQQKAVVLAITSLPIQPESSTVVEHLQIIVFEGGWIKDDL